jgi:hypothetical protein
MPERIHCAYHKCLTAFTKRVMGASTRRFRGYNHFNSLIDDFNRERRRYQVASVNNHALDLSTFGDDARISRFVRDPRDLVVSGYFYHRAGSEIWCRKSDPTPQDFVMARGTFPEDIRPGESYADYLTRLDQEDGLIAEIRWRTKHFESMREWPRDDPRVKVWRYEDFLGHEADVMGEIADHYGWTGRRKDKLVSAAAVNDSRHRMATGDEHVRNPTSGQWREQFTPRVDAAFMAEWADLLPLHDYR